MKKPCARWPGTHRKSDGRPILRKRYVYALTFEQMKGRSVRRDHVLHHNCHNPWCIEPTHLDELTRGAHAKEHAIGGDRCQAQKTHCPAGHPYSEENTYTWRNERHCRTCRLATKRRHNAKLKTARTSRVS